MKKIILFALLFFPFFANANELFETNIDWYNIKWIKLVRNSWYKLIVWVSEKWESLESMVTRYGWVSWVNWAYFCPADYKECWWINKTFADRISNSYDWSATPDDTWPERVIFALDKDQNPFLFRKAHDYSTWRDDIFITWKTLNFDRKKDIFNWIGNHPLLLQDWINKIWESGAIDSKMKAKSLKNFICSTSDWNTIYMWWVENATIYQVPEILKKLWCYNAINLDGGWSTAMMYNNKYIKWPWRNIMDAWIIIPDKNYPVKPDYSKDPTTQKAIETLNKKIQSKFANLDDMTRKQKLFALKSKVEAIILKFKSGSKEKVLYEGVLRYLERQIM